MVISTPDSGTEWFSKIRCLTARHPYWTLTVIVLAALGPFLAKPFNIDDPLFIWAAHQIQAHPADPYGFNVEWGWREFPMWKVTENPPLACYYLAAAAGILGWSELALHTAFLLPVLAAVFGTYRLARHFCSRPMLAALATLFTPVVLVSSLTVTCDVMMLAFWVWAVVFWVEGTEQEKLCKLFAAAGLIALAELTKYYGVCLIPLVTAFSLMRRRPVRRWAQFLLLPLAILLAYQLATQALYGTSLLFRAMDYATFSKVFLGYSQPQTCLTALAFTGGCVAVAAIFAPLLWRARTLAGIFSVAVVLTAALSLGETAWKNYSAIQATARMAIGIQTVVWAAGGFLVLLLAVADCWHRRDASACLLALWVLGTFAFVAFINWTINARSILPMIPAVGILIVRRLEGKDRLKGESWPRGIALCLIANLILALAVLKADYLLAVAVRQNAREVCADYRQRVGTLWFQGHWGFQFYMSAAGASALDFKRSTLKPGDVLAVPSNNTNLLPLDPRQADLVEIYRVPGPWFVTTCNEKMGAGFYASVWGPLPFAFGRVPPENVSVYVLKPLLQAASPNSK
jgi:4-amino-4-deoxy-L-arabinose transferase-like glycosyltransferase